jgi:hypothetical protein
LISSEAFGAGGGYFEMVAEEFQTLMNPSRFGIFTFGNDLASSTALFWTIPSIDRI